MTTTIPRAPRLLPIAAERDEAEGMKPGRRRIHSFWKWLPCFTIGAVLGIILIGDSYAQSIRTGSPSFGVFWVGVLLFMLPAAAFLARGASRRGGMLAVTVGTGFFLYVPKILRNPFAPIYHDEFAHWEQVQEIAKSGRLFDPNTTIPIIQSFPGLHIVTLTLQEITGLSTWNTAEVLLACFHVVDLLAVFLIVEGFTRNYRAGAIAALIYSLNSSYMYFDTQFAYESLGVMLFLTTIAAAQRAERAHSRRARYGWSASAVTIGCSCAVTHHLSTIFLSLLLLTWTVVTLSVRRGAGRPRPLIAITGCVVGFFVLWVATVARSTVDYLKPYLGGGLGQLVKFADGGHGNRTLFGQSVGPSIPVPKFEELSAFISILIVGSAFLFSLVRLHRRRKTRGAAWSRVTPAWTTLFLFGLLYFPSIPFLLAPTGAEGARRSWAFSYLGIAVILAPMIARALARRRGTARGRRCCVLLLAGFVIMLIGNVAAGLDEMTRFPGPYELGVSTRTETPELTALAKWFPATVGVGNRVVSDDLTGLELGTYGEQFLDAPSAGFPTFQLWLNRTAPSQYLIAELSTSDYRYLVIDTQMDLPVSEASGFFSYVGAASSDGTKTITEQDLNRFASYGWLSRVYDSTNFAVYRFQYGSIGRAVSGS